MIPCFPAESLPGELWGTRSRSWGMMVQMSDERWWFCLKHLRVEPDAGCPNKRRLGPYATYGEAAAALERAAERNEQWERENRRDR